MKPIWEDLVQDFLEIGCRLGKEEVENAMNALREEAPEGEEVFLHPALSVGGTVLVVLRQERLKECLFYFTGGRSAKHTLDGATTYK
jgi:hypothetical protein